jgi:hypothetical protein
MIKPKRLKNKRCKQCKSEFEPRVPLQFICSPKCSIEYVRLKSEEKEKKDWIKRKKEVKESLKTKSEYEKDLEKEINHIVRLIDRGHPCISSGRTKYVVNAGHMYSVGSTPSLRYNLLNIFAQSVGDNMYKGGAPREYSEGLRRTFGDEVAEEVEGLKLRHKELHLSIPELKEIIKVARECVRDLKKVESIKPYTTQERIELRRFYNTVLGIY